MFKNIKFTLFFILLFIIKNISFANDSDTLSNKELLKYNCSSCHSLNTIYQQRLSKEQWKEIILLMYSENDMPKMIKKKEDILINYLASNYGN
ncbi:MAG: hypothetical protein P8J46_01370 [Alphaproteobacteria bacterium]|jgi:transposase-like protein|nr:hypothetical protein [Alphaproteobacteria bacterium]